MRIYYDGQRRSMQTLGTFFGRDTYAGALRFGRAASAPTSPYEGEIDDVRLSKIARYATRQDPEAPGRAPGRRLDGRGLALRRAERACPRRRREAELRRDPAARRDRRHAGGERAVHQRALNVIRSRRGPELRDDGAHRGEARLG